MTAVPAPAGGTPQRTVPVLLYHSVSNDDSGLIGRYTTPPETFREHVAWVAENGFDTLTVSDYARALRGWIPLPDRPLLITFDDGYADFLASAAPVLAAHGLVSTLYVTTRPVGRSRRGTLAGRHMLTWAELQRLADFGVEIGGHSHDHVQLDLLRPRRAVEQAARCKRLLEDHLQVSVDSFAYPHGYNSAATRRAVRSVGYSSACGVQNARSHLHDDPWSIARIMLERDDGVDRVRRACAADADPLARPGDTVSRRLWRLARRTRAPLRPAKLAPPTTDGD